MKNKIMDSKDKIECPMQFDKKTIKQIGLASKMADGNVIAKIIKDALDMTIKEMQKNE